MKRPLLLVLALCLLLLLIPSAAQAAPSYDQAVDQLFAQGYPQAAESYLLSLGTNPALGFRWAGTSAELAASAYLAKELKAAGLKNVRFEPVPIDVFEFKSASVQVGSRSMIASTFGGVRPTPSKGLTGEVVYVGSGTAAEYAGLDVEGKLVLVDSALDYFWLNLPGSEATFQGAKGVIMTKGPLSTDWYTYKPDALGSNDGEYDMSFVPMVYVSWQDGDWLKQQLLAGRVTATMKLDEKVKLADEGGVAFNVVGEIPGTVNDGTFVLFASHQDCHFRDSTDDTGAVVNELTIAKAMMTSGYKPKHTVVFMFTTAEEFGYTNAWYDWSSGAWHAITQAHPDWAGRIRMFLNMEGMAAGGRLSMGTSPDLAPWLETEASDAGGVVPRGYRVSTPASTWQDGWTFTAAGVPTAVFSSGGTPAGTYHTQYHTFDMIVWPDMANIAKFLFHIQNRVDDGLLPYALKSRADEVAAAVIPGDLFAAGAGAAAVGRLQNAVNAFRNAANGYEARKAFIPANSVPSANATLLKVEKLINGNLTALSAWDWTIYPHEQVRDDLLYLNQAISALDQSQPKPAVALDALSNVALTSYGLLFSHDVYVHDLTRRDPDYYRVTWGAQGHLINYLDVVPQYRAIEAGTWDADTIAQLKAMRLLDVGDLNSRLVDMAEALDAAAVRVNSVR